MAYTPGSYSQELRTEHQNGEHAEQSATHCPACLFPALSRQPSHEELTGIARTEADR